MLRILKVSILASFTLFAVSLVLPGTTVADSLPERSVTVATGYRTDNLEWNTAGTPSGTNPNILSELTWDGIESFQVKAIGRLAFGINGFPYPVVLRGHLGYGWILAGDNQDSDFDGDNRTEEFSRSNNNSDNGSLFDSLLGIGVKLSTPDGYFHLTPMAGWSFHEQNLTMTDGVQTLETPEVSSPLGPIAGLDSTYESRWYGPWIGVDFEYLSSDRLTLTGGLAYHFVDFKAEADWNLRTAYAHPKSFEHAAERGDGMTVRLGAAYSLNKKVSLDFNVSFLQMTIDNGTHTVYFEVSDLEQTRLNEVKWQSISGMLGVQISF